MTLLKSPDEIRELWKKNKITAEEMRKMLALQRDISKASGKGPKPPDEGLRDRRRDARLREPPDPGAASPADDLPKRRMGRKRSEEVRRSP